jgi:hypothetical protein
MLHLNAALAGKEWRASRTQQGRRFTGRPTKRYPNPHRLGINSPFRNLLSSHDRLFGWTSGHSDPIKRSNYNGRHFKRHYVADPRNTPKPSGSNRLDRVSLRLLIFCHRGGKALPSARKVAADTAPVSPRIFRERARATWMKAGAFDGKRRGRRKGRALITVWLQVRVLPGPPTNSMSCQRREAGIFLTAPDTAPETILLRSAFVSRRAILFTASDR